MYFGDKLLHFTTSSVEKSFALVLYPHSYFVSLILSDLFYSPSYVAFFKSPTPSVSVPGNGNISTSIMCVPLHVQWRLWYRAGEGLSSWDFFSIGLRWHHPWLQSSHVGTFLTHFQGKWEVRLAEVALVLLGEKWRSCPALLNTWKRGVGIRENRVEIMYPVHFRKLNRSVKSSY